MLWLVLGSKDKRRLMEDADNFQNKERKEKKDVEFQERRKKKKRKRRKKKDFHLSHFDNNPHVSKTWRTTMLWHPLPGLYTFFK